MSLPDDADSPRAPARPASSSLRQWSFVWGAGVRRLPLDGADRPRAHGLAAHSLAELLTLALQTETGAAVTAALEPLLLKGLLERWLGDALGLRELADATRAIRTDGRALPVRRWLLRAGAPTYFIGRHRVDDVADLAALPLIEPDLSELGQHIRERIPQERFAFDPLAVAVLDGVRDAAELPAATKPLIACLRLGLRRLPLPSGERIGALLELPSLLDRPGGREALHAALTNRSLETWVESLAPGAGLAFSTARGLPSAIAIDRAVRSIVDASLFVTPRVRARDYNELRMLAMQSVGSTLLLAADAGARERMRDALLGPKPLAGTPADLIDVPEAELSAFSPALRSFVFGWALLRLSFLPLGAKLVRSAEELLAAIAEPVARASARTLAEGGLLSLWAARALGRTLPETLRGRVPEHDFPSLCMELGEPPPSIEALPGVRAFTFRRGEPARFQLHLRNLDPVRAALLDLGARLTPASLHRLKMPSRVALKPGERTTIELQLASDSPSAETIEITIGHAHPSGARSIGAPLRMTARAGRSQRTVAFAIAGAIGAALAVGALLEFASWVSRHHHHFVASPSLVEHRPPPRLPKPRRGERGSHPESESESETGADATYRAGARSPAPTRALPAIPRAEPPWGNER